MLIDCLIDLPTFFCSPTRATRDIVMMVDELEEVKTFEKAILELGWVMSHSGFGCTLNLDIILKNLMPPLKRNFYPHPIFLILCPIKISRPPPPSFPSPHLHIKTLYLVSASMILINDKSEKRSKRRSHDKKNGKFWSFSKIGPPLDFLNFRLIWKMLTPFQINFRLFLFSDVVLYSP